MVGSLEPLRISHTAFDRQQSTQDLGSAFAAVGFKTFDALLAKYTAGPEGMRVLSGEGPVLTDDRPLLEFHRSVAGGPLVDISSLRGDVQRHVVE